MPLASSQAQGKDFDGHVNYQEIRSEKNKKKREFIPAPKVCYERLFAV